MNQLSTTPWQRIKPDDANQEVILEPAIALEMVLQQAGYSLGNDIHTFYTAPVPDHPCALCTRRRTCANNRPVRETAAPRPLSDLRTPLAIRLN